MNVKSIDIAAPSAFSSAAVTSKGPAPESSDVNWFSAQMNEKPSQPQNENSVASRIIGSLSQHSDQLQKLNDRANRDMVKASRSAEPNDMLKANRSMSSFYLESLMTAKMVSKGTQAVEKLTNLQ
jgi:type III secretion system YscI/HrpB-like protein